MTIKQFKATSKDERETLSAQLISKSKFNDTSIDMVFIGQTY